MRSNAQSLQKSKPLKHFERLHRPQIIIATLARFLCGIGWDALHLLRAEVAALF